MNTIVEPKPTPKVISFVQNYISTGNALYIFPITIAAVLDIMSPFGPLLLIAAVLAGLTFFLYRHKLKKAKQMGRPIQKTGIALLAGSFLIFSASAVANLTTTDKGLLSSWSPKVKKWQDAYILSIKEDTEIIKAQNNVAHAKLDQTQQMLTEMIALYKPQLEKPLVEQIPGFRAMKENEQNALLMLTTKVGVNGVVKYKKLIAATNTYNAQPNAINARLVTDNFNHIVRVNGKNIEDTKTKALLTALFLDPEVYNYMMGSTVLPKNIDLLAEFNVNNSSAKRLEDPLGDLIASLKDTPYTEQVVIPKEQYVATEIVSTPVKAKRNINAANAYQH